MKKLLSLLLVGILLIASTGVSVFAAEAEPLELISYEKALSLALENSHSLKTLDNRIILAERALRTAQVEADNAELESRLTDSAYIQEGLTKDYTPAVKERALKDLQDDRDDMEQKIKLDVVNAYVTLMNTRLKLQQDEQNVATAKKEYELKQKEFELGLLTPTQLKEYEVSYNTAVISQEKALRDEDIAQMDLNRLMGVSLTQNTAPSQVLGLNVDLPEYDVDGLATYARTLDPDVKSAAKDLELKKLNKTVVDRYSRFKTPESYDDLDDQIADLEEAYADAQVQAEIDIRTAHSNLLTSRDNVTIAQLRYDLAAQKLEIEQVKNELGMNTALDVVKASNSVRDALETKLDAQLAFYLAHESFKYDLALLNK